MRGKKWMNLPLTPPSVRTTRDFCKSRSEAWWLGESAARKCRGSGCRERASATNCKSCKPCMRRRIAGWSSMERSASFANSRLVWRKLIHQLRCSFRRGESFPRDSGCGGGCIFGSGRRCRGGSGGGEGFQTRGQSFGEQIHYFFCGRTIGVPVWIVLSDIKPQQILLLHKFHKRTANFGKGQAARVRHIDGRKFFLSNDVKIHMHHEFARVCVQVHEGIVRRFFGAMQTDVGGVNMAQRRARKKINFGLLNTLETVDERVWFAHQRRLSPETDEFRRPFADDAGEAHAVEAAGRRAGGSVQVGVAIEPQ